MKFVFFAAQYLPTMGGVERYTNSLAKQLILKGHSVVVVTSALPDLPQFEIDEIGIKIYRMPVKWFMNRRFPVIIPNAEFKKLKQQLKLEKADFAVIQTRFYINSLFGASFCKKNKIPSIVIDHSTSHILSGGVLGFFGQLYEHFAALFLRRRVNCFCAVSCKCTNWLAHFGINTDKVFYNCADIAAIEKIAPALPSNVNFTSQLPTVVFAARLIEEKGVLKLLKAFDILNKNHISANLVIAGSGPLYSQVLKYQCSNIAVTGALSYQDVIALYKYSDIFCLPTDYPEGFPTTILEAAACETMVIATDKGGTKELICNDNYGIILKDTCPETIAAALEKALKEKEYCNLCTQNAKEKLYSTFTWDKVSDSLIQFAQKYIKG